MTEEEFISRIDCAFPYEDEAAGAALMVEASQISSNSSFMIGEELSRLPRRARATTSSEVLLRLLTLLRRSFEHPIRDMVLDVVDLRIRGGGLGLEQALELLKAIEPH